MIGYIYAICYDNEIIYTGSTINMATRWRGYKNQHRNPKNRNYKYKISAFMRDKGFNNCEMMLLESYEIENEKEIYKYEGMWQRTFQELGCDLQNTNQAGNGCATVKGTIAYENEKARSKEKIPCKLCGKFIGRKGIRPHQRRSKCSSRGFSGHGS